MIYFDNASTTYPKFDKLYNESMTTYRDIGINFNRNNSKKSKTAGDIKINLISNLQKIFSTDMHQVIINSSATFSLNEILLGLDYSDIKTVYISPFEHNSVYRVLKKIEKEKGVSIEILKFDKFQLDEDDMALKFLSKNPNLVILTHASNVFGNILPVEKIFSKAKEFGAITVLDTAQTAGVLTFNKIAPLSDFMVFAGHKNLYGPSGIGGYFFNKDIPLTPLLNGGTGIKSEDIEMPQEIPERFEAGSPNILGIIGLEISTNELLKVGIEKLHHKKLENLKLLFNVLEEFDYDIKIHSDIENNIGVISVTGIDYSPKELEGMLSEYDISIRSGMQCAPLAHHQMGTEKTGTVRFSVGYFNKESDFENLRKALDELF